jgi:hypothetical protein
MATCKNITEMEFWDNKFTKDLSLLLHAIHIPFYWRILKKTILLSTSKLESYLHHPIPFLLLLLLFTFSFLPYTFRFISFRTPTFFLVFVPSLSSISFPLPMLSFLNIFLGPFLLHYITTLLRCISFLLYIFFHCPFFLLLSAFFIFPYPS